MSDPVGYDDTAGTGDEYRELQQFVRGLSLTMARIARYLAEHHPDADLRSLYREIETPIFARAGDLMTALGPDGRLDFSLPEYLAQHGLTPGSIELQLKLRGYERAANAFSEAWPDVRDEAGDQTTTREPPTKRPRWDPRNVFASVGKMLTKHRLPGFAAVAKKVLGWANIIAGSLGGLPGAGALDEIKQALESGLDEVVG